MKSAELNKPTVPVSYVLLTLELATERGVDRKTLLKGMEIPASLLDQPDARIGLLLYGHLCVRALQLTREPALGYEFGLRSNLTAHGFLGFGLMCQPTPRDALEFAALYFTPLRAPGWDAHFFIEGSQGVLHINETVPYGVLRQYALDMLMVGLVTTLRPLLPAAAELELVFDCPQPEYFSRYREQLPAVRFDAGANQLRLPLKYLSRPISTANASTARLVAQQCERELAMLGLTDDLLRQVRAALQNGQGDYPDLAAMAERLHLTPRTFTRRLQQHGSSFQLLLDEARHRDSMRLLDDPTLNLYDIAARLGFSTAANFSRAFRGWTGSTPGKARKAPQASQPLK